VQHEWHPGKNWELISGIRIDKNETYATQWSPKVAAQYNINPKISLKASVGRGFKAPDFRYQYMNFRNAAAGYQVFGSQEVHQQLDILQQQGELGTLLVDVASLGVLKPEQSLAFNVGGEACLNARVKVNANLFRNDLTNLIEFQQIALTKDMKPIYSYTNISRVYTEGCELNAHFNLGYGIHAQMGYQFLIAKDKQVEQQVNDGNLYGRDPVTLASYRLKSSDYYGLYNRSRHTAQVRIFGEYEKSGWGWSLRAVYKGPYGITSSAGNVSGVVIHSSDINGNGVLDAHDDFVKGHVLVNCSVSKSWNDLTVQAGIDNLFNYTNPQNIPTQPGGVYYLVVKYQLFKQKQ
jgi:outer membrane receptor for ferrienterochelin and colicins